MKLPIVFTIFLILLVNLNLSEADKKKPCTVAYRCSTEVKPVWATDGKTCHVIRNNCFLLSTNCDRQNNGEPLLKKVEKDKCQSLCSSECPDDKNEVCGYYNETKQTFANQCEMEKYICETGEICDIFGPGPCK